MRRASPPGLRSLALCTGTATVLATCSLLLTLGSWRAARRWTGGQSYGTMARPSQVTTRFVCLSDTHGIHTRSGLLKVRSTRCSSQWCSVHKTLQYAHDRSPAAQLKSMRSTDVEPISSLYVLVLERSGHCAAADTSAAHTVAFRQRSGHMWVHVVQLFTTAVPTHALDTVLHSTYQSFP